MERLRDVSLVLLLLTGQLLGEWGRTADEYIRLPFWRDTRICSDGNGGCWATGMDGAIRPGIYTLGVCHIDRNGNPTWGEEVIMPLPGRGCWRPRPVLDDNGDVILAMNVEVDPDSADDFAHVYLQRISLDRELVWDEEGIALDTFSGDQGIMGVYNGPTEDTYLIHWVRGSWNQYPPRLQLINGDGEFLWGIGGIGLDWPHRNSHFVISGDQCFIVAQNVSPTPSIAIVKIDSDGEVVWDSRLTTLWEDVAQRNLNGAESDREGGVILVYEYERRVTIDDIERRYRGVNAVRISSDGDSLWTRQLYERYKIEREDYGTIRPIINYAGAGRFFVAWADWHRDWVQTFQVVALNVDGEFFWDEPVSVKLSRSSYFRLNAIDSDFAVCYVWRDGDDRENGPRIQQWGQRISLDGERMWGDHGRAIQARNVSTSFLTSDGNGGVITLADPDVSPTLQMINRNGEIGVVLPVSVGDDIDNRKSSIQNPQLNIYPNPGNSYFRIEFDTVIPNEMFRYHIYNLMGKSIKTGTMIGVPYLVEDLSRFSSGEYILQLQSQRTTASTRFLLIK